MGTRKRVSPLSPRVDSSSVYRAFITHPPLFLCLPPRLSHRFNRECARRSKCSGACCGYCLKAEMAQAAGLTLSESDTLYNAAATKIFESRNEWLEGKCGWVEQNGKPCVMCDA